MKLSLMTLNMMLQFAFKYFLDHDAEDYAENWLEMMDMVKAAGYDAVDVTSLECKVIGTEKLKTHLDERGIAVSSLIHMDSFLDVEEDVFDQKLQEHKAVLDTAKALGTKVCMLALAQNNQTGRPVGMTAEQVHEGLLKFFRPLSEYGNSLGLHVVIEDTPNLAFHADKAKELDYLLNAAPLLELVYDSGNMILVKEDPVDYYRQFAGRTAHVHLKDMMYVDQNFRGAEMAEDGRAMAAAPAGCGLVDMPALINALKENNYPGYLTVEFAKHPDLDWVPSLRAHREYYEKLIFG